MFTPGYDDKFPMKRGANFNTAPTAGMTPDYTEGTRRKDQYGREYIYFKVKASTTVTAGQACALTAAGADPVTTTNGAEGTYGFYPVGIAMAAASSSTSAQYMWFCIFAPANALGSCLVNASTAVAIHLATSTTAGALDSATSSSAVEVRGIIIQTSQGTDAGVNDYAIINYPYISNTAHAS